MKNSESKYKDSVKSSKQKKVYISGKITGEDNYKNMFGHAEFVLRKQGYVVVNPAVLPIGLEYKDYIHIGLAMLDVCDAIYLLKNWEDSTGVMIEKKIAESSGKEIIYQ